MSDFLARKVKTYFKHNDVNNDGVISFKDWMEMSDLQSDASKANAVQREKLRECFLTVWKYFIKSAGPDDNGMLTASNLAESVKQLRNDQEFKEAFRAISRHFFGLLDLNGDGFLQEDEYARSLVAIGIKDTSIIRRAFDSMDLNKEGKLSLDEFCNALVEYLVSDDEKSPYSLLWGPLVD